jgi:hypothetical protein
LVAGDGGGHGDGEKEAEQSRTHGTHSSFSRAVRKTHIFVREPICAMLRNNKLEDARWR